MSLLDLIQPFLDERCHFLGNPTGFDQIIIDSIFQSGGNVFIAIIVREQNYIGGAPPFVISELFQQILFISV